MSHRFIIDFFQIFPMVNQKTWEVICFEIQLAFTTASVLNVTFASCVL